MILVLFFTIEKGSLWNIEAIGNLRFCSRLQFVMAFDCHNNHSVCLALERLVSHHFVIVGVGQSQ